MYNFSLFLRSSAFYGVYTALTLLFGFCLFFLQPALNDKARMRFISHWNLLVMFALRFICGVRFKIVGEHHIPKNSPFVALSNHQSQWETFYLCYALRPVSIILKQEILQVPVFGWCISKMKPIAIDRGNPRQALKDIQNKGLSRIKDDELAVLIFPEGTRHPPGEMGKFARSGAQLAIKANVPVLFVSHNSGGCWIPGQVIKRPGTITVVISKPTTTENRTATDITNEAREWIGVRQTSTCCQAGLALLNAGC